ncbi:MAG: serine/threonine-protein kinase [Myxococcota bacterium]|nr:serine/threonine-protein kinase [Myxococcota bacterium]
MTQCSKTALGRYEVLGSIHRGGMGEILLVRVRGSQGFSRKLVLKGILPELQQDEVSNRLFEREARLMASLEHPNIVQVFDVPEIDGVPYLAMEYIRGRNIHQVIQKAEEMEVELPLRLSAHILAQMLRGLHYAHRATNDAGKHLGIVHRDISPGNILISYFGEVKVTDFGIAKFADTPRITGPRSIRGKARYTAPETIRTGDCTPRSDLYSAGVVLSEMILGRPLFVGENLSETLLQIVSEDRLDLVGRILEDVDDHPKLAFILNRALALSPRDRFADGVSFAEALESFIHLQGGPVTRAELGEFMRKLFPEEHDVPSESNVTAKTPTSWRGTLRKSSQKILNGRKQKPLAESVKRPSYFRPRPPPPPRPSVCDEIMGHSRSGVAIQTSEVREADAIQAPVFASLLTEHIQSETDEEIAQKVSLSVEKSSAKRQYEQLEKAILFQPAWKLALMGALIGALAASVGAYLGAFSLR